MIELCPVCSTKLVKRKIEYILLGENLGIFPVEHCQKCNEQFFSKETSLLIEELAKKKGLWDLKSKTKVNKVGSSLSIRLTKRIVDYLDLKKGEEVIIYPENKNKIIVGRTKAL